MKSKLLMILMAMLLLTGTSVFAQDQDPNDPGAQDSLIMVVAQAPNAGLGEEGLVLELYIRSDEVLAGASVGFVWDNPKLQMDSATTTPLIDAAFDLGRFLYEGNSIVTTNTNQRFLFGGASLFSAGLAADYSVRRLLATYYFTAAGWTGSDVVNILDSVYSDGTDLVMSPTVGPTFVPFATPVLVIADPSDVNDDDGSLPTSYALDQNYPNPFNPSTEIEFALPAKSQVRLTVYNILGQEVTTLVNKEMPGGRHSVQWDAGEQASGIYFYKLQTDGYTETRKMMLVK